MRTQRVTHKAVIGSAAAVIALGLLSACGDEKAGGSGSGSGAGKSSVAPGPDLTGVQWGVQSITVGGKKAEPPRGGAYFEINKDGQVQGTFGCNSFSGRVDLSGGTLKVGSLTRTEMYCGDDFEDRAFSVFEGKLTARAAGDDVTLTSGEGDSITLEKVEPAPLIGTEWQVTGLIEGETAMSLPKAAKAHLTFDKDGRVSGNLGCNNFHAKATVHKNGTITLGLAGVTLMNCPDDDVMKTEATLMKLFDGEAEYKITHRALSLTRSGIGLSASAASAGQE